MFWIKKYGKVILYVMLAVALVQIFSSGNAFAVPEEETEPLPADLPQGTVVICVASSINLREEPVVDDNIIAVIHENDVLIFQGWVAEDSEWVYVKFEDLQGYCSSKYLVYNPKALPTPTPTPTLTPVPPLSPSPTIVIPSPSPEALEIDYEPQKTPKVAPTPIITAYENQWRYKSVVEKLSIIPLWLFGVVICAIIFIMIYGYFKRKK